MRNHLFAALAATAALTAPAALAAQTPPPAPVQLASGPSYPVDRVVAVVGSTPILWSQVQERIQLMRSEGNLKLPTDSVGMAKLVSDVVEELVNSELLYQRAKVEKLEVTDAEITPRVDEDVRKIRSQFKTEGEYREALRSSGFGSPEEYRRWLLDETRRRAMSQKLFEKMRADGKIPSAAVTETAIDSFFNLNKDQIPRVPAQVSFRQIVVRPQPTPEAKRQARAKADSLYAEIKAGTDFEQTAKRESMDEQTKELGGDLGWHCRGDFFASPAFEQVMWGIQPGTVSQPVETDYGFHLIRVDRVQPSEIKVRHILIRPRVDSVDIEKARVQADSIANLWRRGGNFDSLSAQHRDLDEERSLQDFPKSRLPQSYQDAIKDKVVNDVTAPFAVQDPKRNIPKFFILQITGITEEHAASPADFRQEIRSSLAQQGGTQRFLKSLRKQTHVEIRL